MGGDQASKVILHIEVAVLKGKGKSTTTKKNRNWISLDIEAASLAPATREFNMGSFRRRS